jgi:predicted permease
MYLDPNVIVGALSLLLAIMGVLVRIVNKLTKIEQQVLQAVDMFPTVRNLETRVAILESHQEI